MKKIILLFTLVVAITVVSCGPAAENREAMYARAKVFQDSIANVLKTSMAEAAAPPQTQFIQAPADTTKK